MIPSPVVEVVYFVTLTLNEVKGKGLDSSPDKSGSE